ncbi:MAG: hypothetical protein ABSD38_10040 [Syntrophorhabdales bacterium]
MPVITTTGRSGRIDLIPAAMSMRNSLSPTYVRTCLPTWAKPGTEFQKKLSNMFYKLKERLEKTGLGGRIAGIETADKMTGGQRCGQNPKALPGQRPSSRKGAPLGPLPATHL